MSRQPPDINSPPPFAKPKFDIDVPDPPGWVIDYQLSLGIQPAKDVTLRLFDVKTRELFYESNPGPQTWALSSWHNEVLVGGRRGGGKSSCLLARPAMGDPLLPPDDPARQCLLNDSSYRALLLRHEYQSMSEFIDEAVEFYKHFDGEAVGDPKYIKFKSGAKIYFNHLGDESAYEKYKGWNLTFIGVEELVQIQTLRRYLKLFGSLRSTERRRTIRLPNGQMVQKMFPALRTQIFSTTNPDGGGAVWVKKRFIKVPSKNNPGKFIAPNIPMYDPVAETERVYIPFPIEANPYLHPSTPAGKRYQSMLMSQDATTRRQWMDGDWEAGTGLFFQDFRPDGPLNDEEERLFPWARHVVIPTAQDPFRDWWFRWGGGDWGRDHPAAFHKLIRNEKDKRIHVYDEKQVRMVGSFELGAMLAQWWLPDLEKLKRAGVTPMIVIHMGDDIFSKTDNTKTRAQQMESGIKEVLGPFGSLLLKYNEDEKQMSERDPKRAALMFQERRTNFAGELCLALKPTHIADRVDAWSEIVNMLRFRPATVRFNSHEEEIAYLKDILVTGGMEEYELQLAAMKNMKAEILPKLQIWPNCKELIRCLKVAQKDTSADNDLSKRNKREDVKKMNANSEGKEGDDSLECLIAETLVATETGQRRIDSIKVGDRVWTRGGLKPVMACGLIKRDAPLVSVEFSNGARLTGTSGHFVFVQGKGFIRLDHLAIRDSVESDDLYRVLVIKNVIMAQTADVYDLSIADQPEYYASGILVHNSARNAVWAYRDMKAEMPKEYFVGDEVQKVKDHHQESYGEELTDHTRLAMIARTQAAKYDKLHTSDLAGFNIPRGGSMRHRN